MNITAFNPLIVTNDSDSVISLFEELGFERRHQKDGINDDISSVSMRDANGFHVNVAQVDQIPRDMTTIRMNVSDFDEAYKLLTDHGFVNAQGGRITDTGTSRATMMVSPSGFSISVSQHIKK